MSTIACLRIAVGDELAAGDVEPLAHVVAKVGGAYLETTWLWPRRFGLVAPFSFVLADPRATRLDARELQALAVDLQAKLFGTKGVGEVCLLMFEGDKTEVMRFAGAPVEQLRQLLDGVDDGAFAGRVCKITPTAVTSVAPKGGPVDGAPTAEELQAMPASSPPRMVAGWRGLYNPALESFTGSVLAPQGNARGEPLGDGDDPFALERDLEGLATAWKAAERPVGGLLLAGFSYPSLVRSSVRQALRPRLDALPPTVRGRLGASLRQVPREPSYGSLSEILRLFHPYFRHINLQVFDPEFRIDCIPADSAKSVTLALSGQDERIRLRAIRRFMGGRATYHANRVLQYVANVCTRGELEACRQTGVRLVSGPVVSELLKEPIGEVPVALAELPYGARRRPAQRPEPEIRPSI